MKLRQKILLLAIAPLIVALLAIAVAVLYQARLLAAQQRSSVEAAYLASKVTFLACLVLAQSLWMAVFVNMFAPFRGGTGGFESHSSFVPADQPGMDRQQQQ